VPADLRALKAPEQGQSLTLVDRTDSPCLHVTGPLEMGLGVTSLHVLQRQGSALAQCAYAMRANCTCISAAGRQHRALGAAAAVPPVRRDRTIGDEHTSCHLRSESAVSLPSRAGGGPRRAATLCAAAGASRPRETSTPLAVRAQQLLSSASLAEGRAERPHCVPPPARRESRPFKTSTPRAVRAPQSPSIWKPQKV
jgi:hypothetical protein